MSFTRPDKLPIVDHRYGWMTNKESKALEALIDRIHKEFGKLGFLEIGVFGGSTLSGIIEHAEAINCPCQCAGVDLPQGRPCVEKYPNYTFYEGDSMDTWSRVTGEFNLLFVDGCHCVNHAMCDFLNYSPFVVVGGYCLFHDTAPTEEGKNQQSTFPQDHSYAGKPPSVLGVRGGLKKMGLLGGHRDDWKLEWEIREMDVMGMMCFKKLKAL